MKNRNLSHIKELLNESPQLIEYIEKLEAVAAAAKEYRTRIGDYRDDAVRCIDLDNALERLKEM